MHSDSHTHLVLVDGMAFHTPVCDPRELPARPGAYVVMVLSGDGRCRIIDTGLVDDLATSVGRDPCRWGWRSASRGGRLAYAYRVFDDLTEPDLLRLAKPLRQLVDQEYRNRDFAGGRVPDYDGVGEVDDFLL